jgi:hypothetical protein
VGIVVACKANAADPNPIFTANEKELVSKACPADPCKGAPAACFALDWGAAQKIEVKWAAAGSLPSGSRTLAVATESPPDARGVAGGGEGNSGGALPASLEELYDEQDRHTYEVGRSLFFARINADQKERDKAEWRVPQNLLDRSKRFAVLFFSDDGKPMYPLPSIDEATEIYGIVSFKEDGGTLRVSSCDRAQLVRVGGGIGGGVESKSENAKVTPPTLRAFHAKSCSADSGLKVTIVKPNNETAEIVVPTLALYRLTVGLSFIYDFTHDVSFRGATVAGEATPVVVRDEQRAGLDAVAFVAFRFVPADMVNTRTVGQMLSPAVGLSLTDPTDHLYVALQVEPWPGLGLILGHHFLREPTLGGGLVVGDRVASNESIPVDKRWTSDWRNVFAGVTLSTDVLAKILEALRK